MQMEIGAIIPGNVMGLRCQRTAERSENILFLLVGIRCIQKRRALVRYVLGMRKACTCGCQLRIFYA